MEKPLFDKNGKEIQNFDLLKIFHFTGVNEQGRGRKHYYMYKWVKIIDGKFLGYHLNNDEENSYFLLSGIADKDTRVIKDAEIVQSYETLRKEQNNAVQ